MAIIYVYSLCKDILYISGMRFVVHRSSFIVHHLVVHRRLIAVLSE